MAYLKKPTVTSYWKGGRRVPGSTPGAVKRTGKARKWYAYGLPGRPRPVPLAADKRAAERLLADLLAGGERAAAGLPDRAAAGLPLDPDLLDRFAEAARRGTASAARRRVARRPGPATVALHVSRLRRLFAALGWRRPADLQPDPAGGRLSDLVAAGALSAQTANHTLSALRRFARWLAHKARAGTPADLFDGVPGFDVRGNRRHERRAATPAELARFLAAAAAGPRHHGLTGPERRLLYLTAFASGLRRGELRRLTPASLWAAADPPELRLDPRTKGGRPVRQPLPPGVAAELAAYAATRPAGGPLFPDGPWRNLSAAMLARDLAAAGIPYKLDDGTGAKALDFHALRYSFATAVVAGGATVKEAQELLRHSTPTLTFGVYAQADRAGLAGVVGRIDPTAPPSPLAHLTRAELEAAAAGLAALLRWAFGLPAGLP